VASTAEGELVFDPFCGSGTTGVAAKELGRFFVGAETEREYAELAGRRVGAAERGITLGEIQAIGGGNPQRARRDIGMSQYEVGMDTL
jgi:site-specific DNA-methyltransferase (adenine-specific)